MLCPAVDDYCSRPTDPRLRVYRSFFRSSTSHRFPSRCLLPIATIIAHAIFSLSAVAGVESLQIWQLAPGQSFSVQATTHRITEIQIGDHHDTTDIADRVTLDYTMIAFSRGGAAQFEVQIRSLERTIASENGKTTTQSLDVDRAFKTSGLVILVTDHGNGVKVPDTESLFRADMAQSHRVLTQISTDKVFCSWLDLPFRIPVNTDRPPFHSPAHLHPTEKKVDPSDEIPNENLTLRTGSEWTRRLHISLGLPGIVECTCNYSVDTIEDSAARLSVTGTTKLVVREPDEEAPLKFKNFHLTGSDVSGEGKILMDNLTGLPKLIEYSQRLTLEGQSVVSSEGGSNDFRFKQSLTQTSITSEFGIQELRSRVPISVSP